MTLHDRFRRNGSKRIFAVQECEGWYFLMRRIGRELFSARLSLGAAKKSRYLFAMKLLSARHSAKLTV